MRTPAKCGQDIMIPPLGAQHREVSQCRFRTGQDNGVGFARDRLAGRDETQIDIGFSTQGIQIIEIADPRQHRNGDDDAMARRLSPIEYDGVFCRKSRRAGQPGHDAERSPSRTLLDKAQTVVEQR